MFLLNINVFFGIYSFDLINNQRNYFMINLHESMGRAGIELAIPGSAIAFATDCATGSGIPCPLCQCLLLQ